MFSHYPEPVHVWLRRSVSRHLVSILEDGFLVNPAGTIIGFDDPYPRADASMVFNRNDWRRHDDYYTIGLGSLLRVSRGALNILTEDWVRIPFPYKTEGRGSLDSKLSRALTKWCQRAGRRPSACTRSGLPWELFMIPDEVTQRYAIEAFTAEFKAVHKSHPRGL